MAVKQFRRPYDYTPWQTKEVIQGEQHTIPMSPPYDIYLIHIPRKETPSTVRIDGFTEVESEPGLGQFQVHYTEEAGNGPLGRITFNAADAGKTVAVDYHACGTAIWAEDRGDGRPNIAELQETLEGVQGGVDALREAVESLEEASGISYESGVSGFAPENVKAALDALAGVRIVEMGSNSNGTYVRWENGLQVCLGWVVVFTGDGTSEIKTGTQNLPASFASGAALWAGSEAPYWRIYQTVATGSVTTSFGWQAERKSGVWTSGLNYPIHFIAVGRWK